MCHQPPGPRGSGTPVERIKKHLQYHQIFMGHISAIAHDHSKNSWVLTLIPNLALCLTRGFPLMGDPPKWLVYNGQSQSKMGWFRGTPISGNHSIPSNISTVLWPSHTTHHYPRLSTSDAASQRLIRAAFCQDQKWPQNVASAAATVPGCTRLYQVPLGWTPLLVFLGENRQTDGGNP